MSLARGDLMIGKQLSPPNQSAPFLPYTQLDQTAIIADLAGRLAAVEKVAQLSVPGDRVLSMIALTPESILIQSEKIAIAGEVTFADWQRDLSGQVTGVLDPAITQIRGGVIRTGKVVSMDGYSWLDLDAVTTTPFLKCQGGVSIAANGSFTLGDTAGKQLVFDSATSSLTLGGSALLAATAVSTVVSNAATGAAESGALASAAAKLAKAGGDTLTGIIDLQVTTNYNAGIRVGDVTWNTSTGALTGGSGIVMTRKGLLGVASGVATFSIDATTGEAIFAGDVETAGHVIADAVYVYGAYRASIIGNKAAGTTTGVLGFGHGSVSGSPMAGLIGVGDSGGYGVKGFCDAGVAVYGQANGAGHGVVGTTENASYYGVYGWHTGGGYAGYFSGDVHFTGTISGGTWPTFNQNTSGSAGTVGGYKCFGGAGTCDGSGNFTATVAFTNSTSFGISAVSTTGYYVVVTSASSTSVTFQVQDRATGAAVAGAGIRWVASGT